VRIPPAESRIMEAIWANEPMTPEDLIKKMAADEDWAEGTVRTLVTRLLRKKAISGGREDGRYVYRSILARETYVQAESQGLLDRLFGGDVAPFVAHFAKHRALSADDVKAIEKLVKELKNERD
jgi:BlaI family penicillinase repressor